MLKITGGQLKGRTLAWKPAAGVRPTSAKVREALFDILGDISGFCWADLCAGSGIIGLEALSRGAEQVVFVERHRPTLTHIRKNCQHLQLDACCYWSGMPVAAYLKQRDCPSFDVIYCDPPYDSGVYEDVLQIVGTQPDLLKPTTGLLILEHRKQRQCPAEVGQLQQFQVRHYGDTLLSFYRRNEP